MAGVGTRTLPTLLAAAVGIATDDNDEAAATALGNGASSLPSAEAKSSDGALGVMISYVNRLAAAGAEAAPPDLLLL